MVCKQLVIVFRTNCMIYEYVFLLITCLCYDFIIYVTMNACVLMGSFM